MIAGWRNMRCCSSRSERRNWSKTFFPQICFKSDKSESFWWILIIYAVLRCSDRVKVFGNTSFQVFPSISVHFLVSLNQFSCFVSKIEAIFCVSCRQSHKSYFDKSDLFFVCMLQPLSKEIQPQEAEIEAAQVCFHSYYSIYILERLHESTSFSSSEYVSELTFIVFHANNAVLFIFLHHIHNQSLLLQWMPFEEYAAQPFIQKHDLLKKISEICAAKKEKREYAGFSPVATTTGFSQKKSYLYINSQCLNLEDSN